MPTAPELFAFENAHPRHTSQKEALIVDELGVKPARYYMLLLHAARSAEGARLDPMLCRRVLDRGRRAA
ncbi:DUF3263 domain-containing protein [Microbacterium sp. Leaf436]|uniref:DUF3263 domain-containing protein n=1 Tax=Microbacterium sp. Leaf436 TaxID=1736377 RepID=UPI0006F29C4E|nr:DUF3263 domain-containing protein [Microbacterium sp. Leaf436]KQT75421.1 hypothetical protein ASG45_02660 [Microbacterium sp. Leaf436]